MGMAIIACNDYLEMFQTDKDTWHELGEIYITEGQLPKALFCYEDLVMMDPRNLYSTLTYAELLFSVGKDLELARKYYCLACEIDEKNLRALWGLYSCNQAMGKRDATSEKMTQLHQFCIQRLRAIY